MQGLEGTHVTSPSPCTTHSPIVTDHSLRFHQDLAGEYVPLGEHTQLRAVKDAECIVLHQETKEVEVEFDGWSCRPSARDKPLWQTRYSFTPCEMASYNREFKAKAGG